jgi:hypothetical protein
MNQLLGKATSYLLLSGMKRHKENKREGMDGESDFSQISFYSITSSI